jgi:hypothetical protein
MNEARKYYIPFAGLQELIEQRRQNHSFGGVGGVNVN